MKISLKVKANSRQEKIEKVSERQFLVWVNDPAKDGKANKAVIELLSAYFSIAKSRIVILRGEKNKNKLISIE